MAKVSISEAIRMSGVGRTTFYSKYINKGVVSVSEHNGKKYIETSELLRVFGELSPTTQTGNIEQTGSNSLVQAEQIRVLKEQLKELKHETAEREKFYQEQITRYQLQVSNLLEAPTKQNSSSRPNPFVRWWRGL